MSIVWEWIKLHAVIDINNFEMIDCPIINKHATDFMVQQYLSIEIC